MTKKLMLATVMVMITLNSVSASDCGWVLWVNYKTVRKASLPRSPDELVIVDAYETIEECKNSKELLLDLALKDAIEQKKIGTIADANRHGDTVYRVMKQEDKENISERESFYCLPGTLDPREKK